MGEVFVVYRVNVEDMEKFDKVKQEISSKINPKEIREEELGFGIKVLKVLVVVGDNENASKVEEELKAIPGISSVEVESLGRL